MLCDVYNMQLSACYATLQMLGARVTLFRSLSRRVSTKKLTNRLTTVKPGLYYVSTIPLAHAEPADPWLILTILPLNAIFLL
jgi:hypothetical protein